MRGAVFTEVILRTWKQALYWGLGIGAMGFFVVVLVPDVEALKEFTKLIEKMPPFLMRAAGVSDDMTFMATPAGFIATGFFGKTLLFLAAYPVIMGMRVTVNEEDEGTMDILLSLPVPRWRVVLEKFVAYLLTISFIAFVLYVCMWGALQIVKLDVDITRIGETILNVIPSMSLILAFTLFVGTLIRTKKLALTIASVFVLLSFLLDTIGAIGTGSAAEYLRKVSFFSYYDSTGVMQNGIVWSNFFGISLVALLLVTAGLWFFERRDVGI